MVRWFGQAPPPTTLSMHQTLPPPSGSDHRLRRTKRPRRPPEMAPTSPSIAPKRFPRQSQDASKTARMAQ
eukprot:9373402-Pyramimonas_sp.AAC.1